ncbi:glycoside hydrolase family 20 zincin-like fold domain-containing protein, partial [Rhizobium brockwellii]|uniref:glycoside hydrolase family 20 zincin-like fold domain-containing protein n=1 Tax=Rhizobium brockwellii TaxID=3019932 RepID=UPI003F979101
SSRRPLPAGFALKANAPEAQAAAVSFTALVEHLFSAEGLIRSEAEGAVPVKLRQVEGLAAEAYRIAFSPETIIVEASAQAGFVYGLVTVGQIWRGSRLHPQAFHFPAGGEIVDEPAMGWR